jgi:hypothetical protein
VSKTPSSRSSAVSGLALHDRTVDGLLAGSLADSELPSGYEGVAELLRAATGPATSEELAREGAAVDALVAATRPSAPAPAPARAQVPAPTPTRPVPPTTRPFEAVAPVGVLHLRPPAAPDDGDDRRSRWWAAVVAAVVFLVAGVAGLLAGLGHGGGRPQIATRPSERGGSASIAGNTSIPAPPPSSATGSNPAPASQTPPSAQSPQPPQSSAPALASPSTAAPLPAPPSAVAGPGAPPAAPPTVAPKSDQCAAIDRLPPNMRADLDRMARAFGYPSFREMCKAMPSSTSGPNRNSPVWPSGGGTGGAQGEGQPAP